jgi:hypothetical protein
MSRPAANAAHAEEIERLQALLEVQLAERDQEIARLKREGTPGVMHEIDQAFYDLTVKERNLERQKVDRLEREIAQFRTRELPRTDNRGYDLRQRFNRAVRWLRDAEDIARIEMPAWPTADRIRDIYEQITDDLLNGKTTVPPLRQRLADAEAEIARLEAAGLTVAERKALLALSEDSDRWEFYDGAVESAREKLEAP